MIIVKTIKLKRHERDISLIHIFCALLPSCSPHMRTQIE